MLPSFVCSVARLSRFVFLLLFMFPVGDSDRLMAGRAMIISFSAE
ncbi:hypothetical protein HDF10_001630 [Edaphobacter lichenicola]|uniref:Uncharacterized protein n=1 Tax=Tunturiibacter lichenicola TaxID=2051959 RepID=A0A7W8N567_9BACT|nr:hypothetical protein [Edaphobacter lichenicola]